MASSAKTRKMSSTLSKSCAFSSEQDEILIELVAQNPTLYDLKLESYKDGVKKENIWKDIAGALNKTTDECKKRWKYIKDSYNRYKRKRKTGTGSAAVPKTSKWEFYERLKFLELSSSPRDGISNIPSLLQDSQGESMDIIDNEDNESDQNYKSDDDDTQSIQSTIVNGPEDETNASIENINNTEKLKKQNTNKIEKVAPKKKRQNKQDEFLQYMKERDTQRQALLKQACGGKVEQNLNEDDVNSFADHIKSVLKKLPPILKVKAKSEIFTVMSKYELMAMENPHSIPSTSFQSVIIVPSPTTSPQEINYDSEYTNESMASDFHSHMQYN